MIEPPENRKYSIEHVIGLPLNSEQRKRIIGDIGNDLDAERDELQGEVEKTADQQAMLPLIDAQIDQLTTRYGGRPFRIPSHRVRLVEPGQFFEGSEGGYFNPYSQEVVLLVDSTFPNTEFLHAFAHEAIHAKSFGVLKFHLNEEVLRAVPDFGHKMGLQVKHPADPRQTYFTAMNEAVTEQLALQATHTFYREQPEWFVVEREETAAVRSKLTSEALPDGTLLADTTELLALRSDGRNIHYLSALYREERMALSWLCERLAERSENGLVNSQAAFDHFARAMFTGNSTILGRLVERTFGNGSFRRIASARSADELTTVIQSLE